VTDQQGSRESHRWTSAYEKWQETRLERVQDSARVWLGVLTTLLGLLGSVVLLKGGDLVTSVTANWVFQVLLIGLTTLVFAGVVLAVILGGMATWGGLQDITKSPPIDERRAAYYRSILPRAVHGFANWLTFPRPITEGHEGPSNQPEWMNYRRSVLEGADIRRGFLHRSRTVGVVAAALIALLAVVAVIAGTVSPAPVYVIVVHQGQLTCGAVDTNTHYKGVTQVVTVNKC
jgi:hypothetical protein